MYSKVKAMRGLRTGAMVAALFFSVQAQAEIIYTGVGTRLTGGITSWELDINGDRVKDVRIRHVDQSDSYWGIRDFDIFAESTGSWPIGTWVTKGGRLHFGDAIGAANSFGTGAHLTDYSYQTTTGACGSRAVCPVVNEYFRGAWDERPANFVTGYLGLQMRTGQGSDSNYGWLQLTVGSRGYVQIHDMAFESCANVGITAGQRTTTCGVAIDPSEIPEPAPLAMLAIGALGIGAIRRRKRQA